MCCVRRDSHDIMGRAKSGILAPGSALTTSTLFEAKHVMAAHDHTTSVEYREIPRLPGYRFGSDGSVWSRRKTHGFRDEFWLLSGAIRNGYPSVWLPGGYVSVHRLILEAFVGPCPPGMCCRHLNGIKADNRIENLTWGTPKENTADREGHGTLSINVGSKHPGSKLNEADIIEIRRLRSNGMKMKDISDGFKVSRSTIGFVLSGKTWKHTLPY
jgi:hypothetical protein